MASWAQARGARPQVCRGRIWRTLRARRRVRGGCNVSPASGTREPVGSLHQLQPPARPKGSTDAGSEANEAALVERARGGDVEAWGRLYQEHFDRVFRYIAYLTGDTQAAEDFVQETFARAFVSLPAFEGRAPLIGWLRGIAVNIVRRHFLK